MFLSFVDSNITLLRCSPDGSCLVPVIGLFSGIIEGRDVLPPLSRVEMEFYHEKAFIDDVGWHLHRVGGAHPVQT